jgi:hypothetical protein
MTLLPTSRHGWICSIVRPLLVICTILLVAFTCLTAFVYWRTSQKYWINATVRTLRSYPPPPAGITTVGDGKWIVGNSGRSYLVFSNGWAGIAINNREQSERLGDLAIMCASDGTVYISHYHFDVGIRELSERRPQPKDLQDFLRKDPHGWQKLETVGNSAD